MGDIAFIFNFCFKRQDSRIIEVSIFFHLWHVGHDFTEMKSWALEKLIASMSDLDIGKAILKEISFEAFFVRDDSVLKDFNRFSDSVHFGSIFVDPFL